MDGRLISKDTSLNRARMAGARPVKLPINEYFKTSCKKVLNVSTAALFIPAFLHTRSWKHAFDLVVP